MILFLFGLLVALFSWDLYKFGFSHGYQQAIDDMQKAPIKGANVIWADVLGDEVDKEYFDVLVSFVKERRKEVPVYPELDNMLRALELTSFEDIKVVILGQDPYHGEGQANGLAFAVNNDTLLPPSLMNIFKEVSDDVGNRQDLRKSDLIEWAEQGVLLLNTILTVEKDAPASHANRGWEEFTGNIIKQISSNREHVVFLAWGNFAKTKVRHVDKTKHLVLESAHPSPLSAYKGFFGCKHFSKANAYLEQHNIKHINW